MAVLMHEELVRLNGPLPYKNIYNIEQRALCGAHEYFSFLAFAACLRACIIYELQNARISFEHNTYRHLYANEVCA
jgi:hypothetical protein